MRETMKPTLGYFNRWYLANAVYPGFAWTGSGWARHNRGLATGAIQICNFATEAEALAYIAGMDTPAPIDGFELTSTPWKELMP